MNKTLAIFTISFCFFVSPAFGGSYDIDPSHTYVGFSVKHMVISNVKGNFTDFSGSFEFDEKAKTVKSAKAEIKTASINTNHEKRDAHLRSPDFFSAEKFPKMKFVLKEGKTSGNELALTGDLTIRGTTKTVTLEGEFLGAVKDPWGHQRAGFTLETKINRSDFGLTWNKILETGGLVVGEKVKIILEVEGVLKK